MSTLIKLPFTVRIPIFIVGMYFFVDILYIAQDIILPILYAIIIAIVISPAVDFLVRKRFHRILSIASVLFVTILIAASIVTLVVSRASKFDEALPQLLAKFTELLNSSEHWATQYFSFKRGVVNDWIANSKENLLNNSNSVIGKTLTTVGGLLSVLVLTPVYVFMILLYQPRLIEFSNKLSGEKWSKKVMEMFASINAIVKSYLLGLLIELGILAILNSAGLYLLGIEYAIILGILGAFLNIIPYLGGAIAVVLYMMVALVTKTPEYVLYVILLYGIIQFIDNNYIVPKIVGSKVKLNALLTIFAVVVGGAVWGIPGMFLSIPLTAIIKLILDHFEPLKPWDYLLGDSDTKAIGPKSNV